MRAIWGVLTLLAAALGLVAFLTLGLGDDSVLVPPPEAVAEGFVRELATHRYARAVPYLSRRLASRVGPGDLRTLTERIEARAGRITDVRGASRLIYGDRAEASAAIKTEAAVKTQLNFSLKREEGVWVIDDLGTLASGAAP